MKKIKYFCLKEKKAVKENRRAYEIRQIENTSK